VGLAPAVGGDAGLQHGWPDRASEIVAAGADGDGNAAPAAKPVRNIGDQRPERGRTAGEADHQTLDEDELVEARYLRRQYEAATQRQRRHYQRPHDAVAVGKSAHQDAAGGDADHRHGVGQGSPAALNREFGLQGRQRHHRRPQANAADRRQQQGDQQSAPGVAAVNSLRARRRRQRAVHILRHRPPIPLTTLCHFVR